MVTENTTPNRGYQEPAVGNTLKVDIDRLVSALRAIDVDVANALAAIVSKAGLNSPAFTGTPTAPTAAPGTDSGQLATTAFVKAAFNALVDSAPGALDTLNELAAAIGDDPNFAATMAALIGTKADAAATTAALALKADASALAAKLDKSGGVMTGSIQDAVLAPSAAPTKRLGFNLTGITAGQKRDIIMPDRNVDLGSIGAVAILADQKAAGTSPGTIASGSWVTRELNTEVSDPLGIVPAPSGNTFTPAYDCICEWTVPSHRTDAFQSRLFNVTDNVVAGVGMSSYASNSGLTSNTSYGIAPVVAGKTYRVEHRCATSGAGGFADGYGTEQYATVKLTRV
ncbi:hypothetical protein B5M44_21490 [Shinella sumterensis]|uniref:hypothetical protein n=1 Tax=Shinella sumterensis TaxID=1967501 RepID=UPI001102F899|nr:hypothetical protein [Shinella sumterensis]TFE95291.1 hypothetical protein B5M44_21490 [Shinella sumterensis]